MIPSRSFFIRKLLPASVYQSIVIRCIYAVKSQKKKRHCLNLHSVQCRFYLSKLDRKVTKS